jgi:Intracellular proteinase inhibitor
MSRAALPLLLVLALCASAFAQQTGPSPTAQRRGWMSRMLHPFRSERLPDYKDSRLRGLTLALELSPQPVKLSEVRQLNVTFTLINKARNSITLDFPSTQRFEIYLRNPTETVLATWSDNHAFTDDAGTVLINPEEHIEYAETIATRELTPNKVFIAEVFFPKYPEVRVRQKFMTAP